MHTPAGNLRAPSDISRRFSIGGVAIELTGGTHSDVALSSGLEAFQSDRAVPDIRIQVGWVSELSPSTRQKLFDSGSTWQLHEVDDGLQFDFFTAIFGQRPFKRLLIDHQFRTALLQKSEECLSHFEWPLHSLGYPLDELLIMHRLTQEKAIELHGSGIVRCGWYWEFVCRAFGGGEEYDHAAVDGARGR